VAAVPRYGSTGGETEYPINRNFVLTSDVPTPVSAVTEPSYSDSKSLGFAYP
jgi:hypothetical protein